MSWSRHILRASLLSLALAAGAALPPPLAAAQMESAAAAETENDRGTAFRTVSGPQTEDVPGGPLAACAYGLVFLLLLAYVWRIGRLQAGTARELARLERALGAAGNEHEA